MVGHVQAACDERVKALMECQDDTSKGDPGDDKREAPSKRAPVQIASAPGRQRAKSASAPAAPVLAAAGEGAASKPEVHSVSRSSPDTPLSDRLGSAHAGHASSRALGSRAGSWASPPRDSPDAAAAGAAHADEALSCTASLSGSISERSINLCFAGGHSSPLTHADGGRMAAAADELQPAQEGSADRTAGTAGPSVVLGDHRRMCENPFARNRSFGPESARQLRRKLSGNKLGSPGQPERHRLGRPGGNGLAQGQLSLLLKQQQQPQQPAAVGIASPGSQRTQQSLLSMQLKGLGIIDNPEGLQVEHSAPSHKAAEGAVPLQQKAVHARQTSGQPRCSMSVTEPLLAAPEEAEQSPHGPPAPFWQATLMAASSAPRPNLAASLGDPTSPAKQPQHATSEVLPGSSSSVQKQALPDQDEELMRQHVQKWLNAAAAAASGRSGSTTPLPHHCPTSHMGNKLAGKERVSPEAMELIQAMDRSLVTPARSESGFPGPLALPIDISSRLLTGGVQAVCAGFSPAGRHAKVPPRQASGHLTSLKRARTCQGSLPDPEEVLPEAGPLGSWAERVFLHLPEDEEHCS